MTHQHAQHSPQVPPRHTWRYRLKHWATLVLQWLLFIGFIVALSWGGATFMAEADRRGRARDFHKSLREPITITVASTYQFRPEDEVRYKEILNVGLTYYSRNDGYTPGHTTRSGRFVYEGAIAVSHPLWKTDVRPGDLIYVEATDRWYKVEDTMNEKYTEPRVDIYTEDMALAQSGSSRTNILIMRQPR